jgi:class 3 adenylate cyclase
VTELPTGVVTFVFTDIESSTRLWEQYPQAMRAALTCHNAILRHAIETHDGVIFGTAGDAFYAAFSDAPAALAAALAAQRALCAQPWDEVGALRVRIALHTSAVELRDGNYFGPPLNRVARLLVAGHGGQTLLSLTTQELVRDDLPPGVALRDLGEHYLKDLIQPEQIFQLVATDLPADFPPLRTGADNAVDKHAQHSSQQIAEGQFGTKDYAWEQAKLPDMPGIDYDVVLEKDRQLNRRRRSRKRDENGGLF